MKYVHKYVHKDPDCITVQVTEDGGNVAHWDEVQSYLDCRYVSLTEAAYKLMEYPLSDRSHSVLTLPVHLDGENAVVFNEDDADEAIDHTADKLSKLQACA